MKKFAALILAVVLVFSLVSCGGNDGATLLKNYVESSEFQTQIDALKQQFTAQGMDLDITVDGEKLVYSCKYLEQVDNTDNVVTDALKSALDTQSSTFTALATQLKDELKITNASVLVKYLNADGTELASSEFKPQ